MGTETYSVAETIRLQNIKTRKWDVFGVVTGIRTADDNTILSYDINVDGNITSRHQRYMCKVKHSNVATEEDNSAGADQASDRIVR